MSIRTKVKPQNLIKETFYRTKKFFHRTLRSLKSYISEGYQKLPKTPTPSPMFANSNKLYPKFRDTDSLYKSFTKQCDSSETPKEQKTKGDDQCSKSSDCSGLEGLKQEKKARKCYVREHEKQSFLAVDALARKMKELEMMDVNDDDHVLDVEEVLHYYSQLTCPAYQEIVDKFFIDMYSEFNIPPQPSRNSSMRKMGSASVYSSMRSLGPIKL